MSRERVRERRRTSGYDTAVLMKTERETLLAASLEDSSRKALEGFQLLVQDTVNRMILLETQGSRTPHAVKLRIDSLAPVMTEHPDMSFGFVQEVRLMVK